MRRCIEDNAAGEFFELFELLAERAIIVGRRFHLDELLRCQGDSDGFLRHLAGPLVTRTAPLASSAILDRTLTNVA